MNENDINFKSKQAIEQMREMNKRANFQNNSGNSILKNQNSTQNHSNKQDNPSNFKNKQINIQNFNKKTSNQNPTPSDTFFGDMGFSLPKLLTSDADATLIIGLLLILMSENTDKILLFALIYILI